MAEVRPGSLDGQSVKSALHADKRALRAVWGCKEIRHGVTWAPSASAQEFGKPGKEIMQPFDALTMRAVLQEARSLLLSRRIEKIYQVGRDEIILAFRLKAGPGYFLLSAQASFGRLCMINNPQLPKHVNPPAFCQLLRKHLSGATLMEMQQIPGERVVDLNFSCTDELGTRSNKTLTSEIMGRHSNLIFWDNDSRKIIGASHVVTSEMSRQREVGPGLPYARPPQQEKPSIFLVGEPEFKQLFDRLRHGEKPTISVAIHNSDKEKTQGEVEGGGKTQLPVTTVEQWLISAFAGIGRHLAEEVVVATGIKDDLATAASAGSDAQNLLWARVSEMQKANTYKPALKTDLTRYTVLSWWPELQAHPEGVAEGWKTFPAVNDMVEDYFRTLQMREQMQQLRDRIKSELRSETEKVESRLAAAQKQLGTTGSLEELKKSGDIILANIQSIEPGQAELICEDIYKADAGKATNGDSKICIALNPNLSASQNAQHYYRQFAKARVRQKAAGVAQTDAAAKMEIIKQHLTALDQAKAPEELNRLKEMILDRGRKLEQQQRGSGSRSGGSNSSGGHQSGAAAQKRPNQPSGGGQDQRARLMSTKSSDNWLIYIGRNKNENDILISKLAQPQDIWFHVQGQEGAHVLIKNPAKQDPPLSTIKEAAQLAARFSRVSLGSKVRVIYTHVKFVKKLGKDKPGLVRYENEKTIEVDTALPIPPNFKKLFER
jgi:predicted ribosome quality control (RQC) complex YloA/Tae2 family protein